MRDRYDRAARRYGSWWAPVLEPTARRVLERVSAKAVAGANANGTDEFRLAHVNIYVDRELRYDGKRHVCTDPLGLERDTKLPDDGFPPVPR